MNETASTERKRGYFYAEWYRQIKKLPEDQQLPFYDAICGYMFDGIEPHFSNPLCGMAWGLMKSVIDYNLEKYEKQVENSRENGKRGGRPRKTDSSEPP